MTLLRRALRLASLVLAAPLACACSGGWTGEITTPTACDEVTGTRPLSELGAAEASLLRDAEAPVSAALRWEIEGAGETEIVTSVRATGGDAQVIGGEGCERPLSRVPVEVRVRTSDGRLDEVLPGTVDLRDAGGAAAIASAPASSLRGALVIEGEGSLRADVSIGEGGPHGQILFDPASDAQDQTLLALW